jgi:dephospho-CoA kinase
MKTFGLTGGIGMGKSTAAQILRDRRVAVVDTDDLARQLVEPGEPALAEILQAFGGGLCTAGGGLNREALAGIVFSDPTARARLEAILHPRIAALWQSQLQSWQHVGRGVAVVVIPLLFETQAEAAFDSVVCVACSEATQHQRLRARGWTPEQIRQRLAAQLTIPEKILRSQFVLWTEGEVRTTERQLARIIPS